MSQSIGAAPLPPAPAWDATGRQARALATISASPDPADLARIEQALAQLRSSPTGREVADFLAASRVDIRVLPDEEFNRRYPGAGGVYDPKTRDISLPRRALSRASLVTTLAHEGKHAMDFADRPHWIIQSMQLIGGSAGDGASALVHLRNPITGWLDSLTARQNEAEVAAYHLQAKVAHELGRNESSWAHGQARDGTPLPIDQVRTNIATDELYRMGPTRRLLLGGGLGVATTSFATWGVQTLAAKVAPGSYLARHSWPMYVVGGALTAAWVGADQIRARRLEAAD